MSKFQFTSNNHWNILGPQWQEHFTLETTYHWHQLTNGASLYTVTLSFSSYPEERLKVAAACATRPFSPRSRPSPSCPIRGPRGYSRLVLGSPGFVHGVGVVPALARKSTVPQVKRFQSGFVGYPNKLARASNGNTLSGMPLPKPNTWKWKCSFFLPNGMRVFDYIFYGQDRLWIHFVRRAQPSYIDVSRSDSRRLYGIMLRAVASRRGGPGRRWRQENKRLWRQSRSTLDAETLTSGIHLRRLNTTTTLTIGTHLRMVVLQSVSQCGAKTVTLTGAPPEESDRRQR